MSLWFRMYEATLDDPKVQRLPGEQFKGWVNLLCLAARHSGTLPLLADISFSLRKSPKDTERLLEALRVAGLLDETETGLQPHNWHSRQYQSDGGSTERVQRYREKRRQNGLPALGDYSKFRAALIDRDGEKCIYCEATDKLVVDHMVPIALGGTDAQDNLALACKACNSGKAGRTPELANMVVRVPTAAKALARYRDTKRDVTVTETPSESETESETESEKIGRARARKTTIPPDWKPTAELIEYAKAQGCRDPLDTFERFRLHHGGKGTAHKDWAMAAKFWCRNEKKFNGGTVVPRDDDPWAGVDI